MVVFVSINFMMLCTTQTIIKNKTPFLFIERAKNGRVQEYEIDAKNGY